MDNFLKRLNEVIQIEATTSSVEDFLVTHKPFKNLYNFSENQNSLVNPLDEDGLYKYIFHENIDNHQFVVVQGTHGCGKSHLIRWMKVRLQEEIDKSKYAILLISRNHNTLQDAIIQILDSDIFPDEIKNNQIKHLKEDRASGLTGEDLKKQIIFNFTLAINNDKDKEDLSLNKRYRDMLSLFLGDPYIQEKFLLTDNSPIEKIRQRMETTGNSVNLDESPIFSVNDFDITVRDVEDRECLGISHQHVKDLANKLLGFTGKRLKEDIAKYLNSKVSEVIEQSERFKKSDLKALFDSLRVELKKQGKSLIMFIEDLTSFTGLDGAIVDVLATNNMGDGDEEYCNIISVVGLTTAYYQDYFPDHFKVRITKNILINTKNQDNSFAFFQNKDDLAIFAGKYINAINLDSATISQWVKDGADYSDLPVFTGYNKHFWANVEDNGKLLTIYPFNKNALWNLYLSIDENNRTTRAFLHNVLKYLLSIFAVRGKDIVRDESIYNSSAIIKIPSWSNERHYEQDCDSYNVKDSVARKILFRIWGNRTTEKVDNKVGDVDKEIFEEFDVSTDIFDKQESTISAPIIEEVNVAPTKTTISDDDKKYDSLCAEINKWQATNDEMLPSHIILRELLCQRIINTIDWNAFNVPRQMVEFFTTKNIKIENQTQDSGKYAFEIKKSLDSKYALIAIVGFKFKGKNSWNYDNSIDDYINFMTWLKSNEKDIVEFVKDQKKVNYDTPFANISSEYYLKVLLGKISYNFSDLEIAKELVAGIQQKDIDKLRSKNYSKYWTDSFDYILENYNPSNLHSLNMNYFKRLFGDRDTMSVSYNFFDMADILKEVKKLRKCDFLLDKLLLPSISNDGNSYLSPLAFINYLIPKFNKMIEDNKSEIEINSVFLLNGIGKDHSEDNVKMVVAEMEKFLKYLEESLNITYPYDKFAMLTRGEVRSAIVSMILGELDNLNNSLNSLQTMEIISNLDIGLLIKINELFGNYAMFLNDCKNNFSNTTTTNNAQVISKLKDNAKNVLNTMVKIVEEVE